MRRRKMWMGSEVSGKVKFEMREVPKFKFRSLSSSLKENKYLITDIEIFNLNESNANYVHSLKKYDNSGIRILP
jgi:hypothetical protein